MLLLAYSRLALKLHTHSCKILKFHDVRPFLANFNKRQEKIFAQLAIPFLTVGQAVGVASVPTVQHLGQTFDSNHVSGLFQCSCTRRYLFLACDVVAEKGFFWTPIKSQLVINRL